MVEDKCTWQEIPFGDDRDNSLLHHRYIINCGHGGINILGYYTHCPFCKRPIKENLIEIEEDLDESKEAKN